MNKVWLITGAGSGIGAETAKAALRAGDRVVATGRKLDKLHKALHDVISDRLALVELDVANEAQAQAAAEQAVQQFGRIDVLVNNAGYSLLGNFEELSRAEIEQQFATNFYGAAFVMRAVLPIMRKQRAGRILNISSVAGVAGLKHCSAYSATKFALEGLSLAVATEVEPFGIRITVVEPGFFRTDLLAEQNARYPIKAIDDYAVEGTARDMWSGYDGQQQGDPAKLGAIFVELAAMADPPKVFAAGSDALAMITPVLEGRLQELRDHAALSRSTDGAFQQN
ncbi:SDR family oxidoreductase [Nevskia ramosa]|uniref:SDR family oxidoreductase n=1 Tax=Nevskia ramosa TaxID=64002 RepID=UPI0003B46E71|nr:SDR family oxidoreductase [Nevskia ramosa]